MLTRRGLFRWVGGLVGVSVAERKLTIDKKHLDKIGFCGNAGCGRLMNCYAESREDQQGYMFEWSNEGGLVPNLEGYAIVPIEKWERLTGEQRC